MVENLKKLSGEGPHRPPIIELIEITRAFEQSPVMTVVIAADPARIVYTNARYRAVTGAPAWTDIDVADLVSTGEREIAKAQYDEFLRTGQAYSIMRTVEVDGDPVQVLNQYWMIDGFDNRFAVVTTEPVAAGAGVTLAAWIDKWPQPCALMRSDGTVEHLNRRLQTSLGLDARGMSDGAPTLKSSMSVPDLLRSLADDPGATACLEVQPEAGRPIQFLIALAPLPANSDPDLRLVVGHELDRGAAGGIPVRSLPAVLSPRERDVAALLLSGHRVATIAEDLYVSPHTVRNHLRSMFRKLDVSSQAELMRRLRA